MKLYFNVDRANRLKAGDEIKTEPYHGESPLAAVMPYAADSFLQDIDRLCRDGLSLHGAQYLIKIKHDPVYVKDFLLELQFEYIRKTYYKHMPSRLRSLFAFTEYEQALKFNSGEGSIFEIDFSGRCFIGDMNWLGIELNPETQKHNARQYWEGKPRYNDADYEPQWECVIDLPVKISREITV